MVPLLLLEYKGTLSLNVRENFFNGFELSFQTRTLYMNNIMKPATWHVSNNVIQHEMVYVTIIIP